MKVERRKGVTGISDSVEQRQPFTSKNRTHPAQGGSNRNESSLTSDHDLSGQISRGAASRTRSGAGGSGASRSSPLLRGGESIASTRHPSVEHLRHSAAEIGGGEFQLVAESERITHPMPSIVAVEDSAIRVFLTLGLRRAHGIS